MSDYPDWTDCYRVDGMVQRGDPNDYHDHSEFLGSMWQPHICTDPNCPGNRTRLMLEAGRACAAVCENICLTMHATDDLFVVERWTPERRAERRRLLLDTFNAQAGAAATLYKDAGGKT